MNIWSNRKVRYLTCAVGVTAIAVPVGIGVATSSSVASPAQAPVLPAAAALPATNLQVKKLPARVLLTSDQLGPGWKAVNMAKLRKTVGAKAGTNDPAQLRALLGDVTVSPSSCADLLTVPNGGKVTGVAGRAFQRGNSMFGPYVAQAVVKFSDAASASAALGRARSVAAACADVTVTTKYGPITGVVAPLSVPNVGSDRVGYKIDANLAGFISVDAHVTAVQKGKKVVIVGQVGSSPNASLTKSLTRKAVKRA